MKQKVLETIQKYNLIESGDKLVLGVSGGPDSISMLNILWELKNEKAISFDFVVAHINHQIREEAILDEQYVEDFCKKLKVKCFKKRIEVEKYANTKKIGTEEAGRVVRYDFFNEVLKETNSNKIAIAHNKNDKVETMIMNLLRGSGISGLRGIEPKRDNIIRPLIEIERHEIEDYCEKKNLRPRIDKTNFQNTYTRNKVRNIVIPYIKEEFNPNIIQTMVRLSEVIDEEESFWKEFIENKYQELKIEEDKERIIIDLKKFNKQENVVKARLIRTIITKLRGSSNGIEKIHIQDIITLCKNNIGNKFLTPQKGIKVFVNKGKIEISIYY